MPFIILFLLIIVHELGHFLSALFLKIDVDKIYIYPFGGISKLNISLNESLIKELIILIMGPVFQIMCYLVLSNMDYFYNYHNLIRVYHYTILTFNLLPIYPLDGGKLLNILFSFNLSFKKSLNITIYISYFTIILYSIYLLSNDISLNIVVIISFLLYKVGLAYKRKKYLFDKFLLERYLYKYSFKKRKVVDDIDGFVRGKYHIIKENDKYYTEKSILNKKFNNKY